MKLPFTFEQFMQVFRDYNTSIFPIQILLYILAVTAIFFLLRRNFRTDRIISTILAFFWLWMAIIYHLIFFSTINKAAYLFGTLFIVQGVLFLWSGVYRAKLRFSFDKTIYGISGIVLILFATGIYPVLNYLFGHIYPATPTFGLPCPTTIFSFGMLLFLKEKYPATIFIIPVLWSIVGFTAAFALGMYEDISLIFASLFSIILLVRKKIVYEKH